MYIKIVSFFVKANVISTIFVTMSSSMICVGCSAQFTFFKRKNRCLGCKALYCSQCFKKGESLPRRNNKHCLKCHALSSQPFIRSELMLLSIKDLKAFLVQKNVSATGCTEKGDLVDVIINHQARPQAQTPRSSEPQPSTQATASSTQSQQASQGMNNFFGLQINPEIHRYVQTMFNLDDSDMSGLRSPNRDEIHQQRHDEETLSSFFSHLNQPSPEDYNTNASSQSARVQTNQISLDSLKDVNDVRKLSAKELKALLDDNFVDYKGCVEKEELVQRAWMILESKKVQQNEAASASSETPGERNEVCKVCMDRVIDCVFLECGHLVTCIDCGKQLRDCPMCRQNIARIVRVFKS